MWVSTKSIFSVSVKRALRTVLLTSALLGGAQPLWAYQIVIIQQMSFVRTDAGKRQVIVSQPDSGQACLVNIKGGKPGDLIAISVVEKTVLLKNLSDFYDPGVRVTDFQMGGDLRLDNKAYFNRNGEVNHIRIGATATTHKDNVGGQYAGAATIRILNI